MAEISNAAIGRLAVELAENDGFAYQVEYTQPGAVGKYLKLLDDEGRERYRALARAQLERECGNA